MYISCFVYNKFFHLLFFHNWSKFCKLHCVNQNIVNSLFQFYIHSNFDVAHATMESSLVVREGEELEINYRMQETTSAVSLRSLRPSQRKCRFEDEPQTNDIAVYSTSICYIICRYKMTLKLCGCRPFFYHKFGK